MKDEALRLAEDLIYVSKNSDSEHWDTLAETAIELRRQHEEIKALRAAVAAVRFQCEADAKVGEWTTCITKLLDAIKAVEEGK